MGEFVSNADGSGGWFAPGPEDAAPPTAGAPEPASTPAGGTVVDRRARVEELRAMLLPQARGAHTPAVLAQLEGEYLDAVMALESPGTPPPSAERRPAPAGATQVALDQAAWDVRLGPVRGPEGDIEVPEGSAWDASALNAGVAALTAVGFPGHLADDLALAERAILMAAIRVPRPQGWNQGFPNRKARIHAATLAVRPSRRRSVLGRRDRRVVIMLDERSNPHTKSRAATRCRSRPRCGAPGRDPRGLSASHYVA